MALKILTAVALAALHAPASTLTGVEPGKSFVPSGPYPAGTVILHPGDKQQLTPHFTAKEWYSTSPAEGFGAVPAHPIYPELLAAAEILREHYNTPWKLTSTYRNEAHERYILKMLKHEFFIDQHMRGKAFDSHPANRDPKILADLGEDFVRGGELYCKLREAGIAGFGLYDWGIHLDCRDDEFHAQRKDPYGFVAHWDNRSGEKKSWNGAFLTPTAKKLPRLAENSGRVLVS